jgi:hypothetical protein
MTDQELNEYLESIGGLIIGYRTDLPPVTNTSLFWCGTGWNQLIKDLIEDLIALGWDRHVIQVKEKFGGLRFYIDYGSDEMYNRISKAENDSYTICEETGKTGELRTDIGWMRTLCDEEYEKAKAKRIQATKKD